MTKLGEAYVFIAAIFAVIALGLFALEALDQPVVQVSYTTGECKQIIYKGLNYECTSLEGKDEYSIEWVK